MTTAAYRCNCSPRQRSGALMTPAFKQGDLRIISGGDDLALRPFNPRVAERFFRRHCGVDPFHRTRMGQGLWRANIACLYGVDSYARDATVSDSASFSVAGDA
ncbi:type I-B CRISPR-associated protein Cas8b1/Cst1 [Paraburkholderia sp. SARCC-3016]|uniref:type I-B CRISPR-associated protein Cas8b1/Cst1 n=1 Tax=Paraburkholderia sp. SARCC-3016 TaxID=3058611 RepID=UPI002807DE49|nr:type I-B CRISPR-associated protein Cas8b1/Cst1 [Paraburkholderia sp. SARCC-3016]MDQ7982013.1 type I-B CRISPR-associated protein Cas8b1/Cst1 [Paraburkholderia sp. SARCC-3016]